MDFMKKEGDRGKVINFDYIKKRVSEATRVSLNTLKYILKEYEHNKQVGKEFSIPTKNGHIGKLKVMPMILISV